MHHATIPETAATTPASDRLTVGRTAAPEAGVTVTDGPGIPPVPACVIDGNTKPDAPVLLAAPALLAAPVLLATPLTCGIGVGLERPLVVIDVVVVVIMDWVVVCTVPPPAAHCGYPMDAMNMDSMSKR